MILFIIILVIWIIILSCDNIYNCINKNTTETYDAKMSNLTLTQCGTQCTQGFGCVGFGYKPNGDCYLSKDNILGRPYDSLYGDEYTRLDKRCNKMNKLAIEDRIDDISLTQNSVYVCSDGENNVSSQYQYANYGATSLEPILYTIFDMSDTDIISPTNVVYPIKDIPWPKNKQDLLPGFITEDELKNEETIINNKNVNTSINNNNYDCQDINNINDPRLQNFNNIESMTENVNRTNGLFDIPFFIECPK
jgi:hypothetical protein